MGDDVIQVLEAYGVRVTFPRAQNCCGLIALNSGDRRHGASMAHQTIITLEKALAESGADYILSASSSCVATIVQDYIKLFEDLKQYPRLEHNQALPQRVIDFTYSVDRILPAGKDCASTATKR